MVLKENEARMKREDQLIDVLNIELDVRDITPSKSVRLSYHLKAYVIRIY